MKPELEKILYDSYPQIFQDRNKSPLETSMCWGIDCGDGWFDLLDSLCSQITYHLERHPDTPPVVAFQVKEKWGGLRFYVNGGDQTTDNWISFAEHMSYRICEVCGSPGTTNRSGWITTRCVHHRHD